MFDTLKQMVRRFWIEARHSYNAHKQGGEAAERAREHERELGAKVAKARTNLAEEQEAERLAKKMFGAKSPEDKQAALDEITKHILKAGK